MPLDPGRPNGFAEEYFPFQIGGHAAGHDLQQVRLPGGEIAFLPAKHPERAQDRRGRRDRHADGGGKILGHVPVRHHVGVFQHHGMAQQGLQVGDGALQRPRRGGEPIMGQAPARPQFQLAGGIVQQIQCGRLAIDGLGAAAQDGLQAGGQVAGLVGVRQQRDAGRQLGLALPEGVPGLQHLAEHAGQRGTRAPGPLPPAPADWLVRRRDRWRGGGRGRAVGSGLLPPGRRPFGRAPGRSERFEPEMSESSSDARVDRGGPTQAVLLAGQGAGAAPPR